MSKQLSKRKKRKAITAKRAEKTNRQRLKGKDYWSKIRLRASGFNMEYFK